jgi:hypothetical protein
MMDKDMKTTILALLNASAFLAERQNPESIRSTKTESARGDAPDTDRLRNLCFKKDEGCSVGLSRRQQRCGAAPRRHGRI